MCILTSLIFLVNVEVTLFLPELYINWITGEVYSVLRNIEIAFSYVDEIKN